MTEQEILDQLTVILRDLLSDDSIVLAMDTERADVPEWDSFNYVNFIIATELKFGVKFKIAQLESFEKVGEIVAATKAMVG